MSNTALETLVGPLLITVCIAFMLYGIFLAQVLFYWTTYKNDRAPIKVWVVILSLLETSHTILCVHFLYYYFVAHFGDSAITERVVWSAGLSATLGVPITLLTLSFYIYRIWHDTSTFPLKSHLWSVLEASKTFRILANVSWVNNAVTDIVVTLTLVYYLYRNRQVGVRTKNMIGKLIHYSVTTGLLAVIGSLLLLISFSLIQICQQYNVVPHSLLFAGLIEALSKLYANSALAMLNARRIVASTSAENGSDVIELSQSRVASQGVPDSFISSTTVAHISEETAKRSDSTANISNQKEGKDNALMLV
ncbi:hypothetical protein BDW22DRAFT_1346399 [Trametopsis cervina]|nr:hypothetical protein BDW22DRAFT_1346399 [Trametopsis cervina]